MKKKRRDERIPVDLPIQCSLPSKEHQVTTGKVKDLSICGMQLHLPLTYTQVKIKNVDFTLELPEPFIAIKGRGSIQWKRWDHDKRGTVCGLKLEPLGLKQLQDIDTIVNEINPLPDKNKARVTTS
jgi:hypothetical protein